MIVTELETDSEEYQQFADVLKKYKVHSIVKVANAELEKRYNTFRVLLRLKRNQEPKELRVYHGCSGISSREIMSNGFNTDFNTCGAYGKGTYFSPNINTALGYVWKSPKGKVGAIIVCSLLLGKTGKAGHNQEIDTQIMDASVDNESSPNIICLPLDEAVVPRYVIRILK